MSHVRLDKWHSMKSKIHIEHDKSQYLVHEILLNLNHVLIAGY